MTKKTVPPAEVVDPISLANALVIVRNNNLDAPTLVHILIDEAVDPNDDEDAAIYALAAARLITAFKLVIAEPTGNK